MSQKQAVPKEPVEALSDKLAILLGENKGNSSAIAIQMSPANIKEQNEASQEEFQLVSDEDDPGIKFKDWGFQIERLFEVALRFYKRNESKAFHPSFDIRNQMNALILQAKFGNFDDGKAPDIGVLDLVGKSRRNEWTQLRGMSKTEAMSKFVCTLDQICPFFKAYAEAVKISYGSQLQQNSNNGNHQHDYEYGGLSSVNNNRTALISSIESDDQLKTIHTSLCKQTYGQFKSYAAKQYPHDPEQQKYLIRTLQGQYFQKYISQMHPHLTGKILSNQENPTDKASETSQECVNSSTVVEHVPPEPTSNDVKLPKIESEQNIPQHTNDLPENPPPIPPTFEDQVNLNSNKLQMELSSQQEPENEAAIEASSISSEDDAHQNSEAAGSPLHRSISYEPLEPATIWTKKGVQEFKDSLTNDKYGGSYVVKQGTLLTIQVPTFPDGRFIHWEFATDDYDIGFGLDFLCESNLEQPLALRFLEETDEDEFEDEEAALDEALSQQMNGTFTFAHSAEGMASESGGSCETKSTKTQLDARQQLKIERIANTVSIIPTYRRDSHEEVFVGRHRYPDRGYYLLKFDNTYSVLRSKSVYFRICYLV